MRSFAGERRQDEQDRWRKLAREARQPAHQREKVLFQLGVFGRGNVGSFRVLPQQRVQHPNVRRQLSEVVGKEADSGAQTGIFFHGSILSRLRPRFKRAFRQTLLLLVEGRR